MNYWESFACEIQSDENWVETLIHMENINQLLEEEEQRPIVYFAPSSNRSVITGFQPVDASSSLAGVTKNFFQYFEVEKVQMMSYIF